MGFKQHQVGVEPDALQKQMKEPAGILFVTAIHQ